MTERKPEFYPIRKGISMDRNIDLYIDDKSTHDNKAFTQFNNCIEYLLDKKGLVLNIKTAKTYEHLIKNDIKNEIEQLIKTNIIIINNNIASLTSTTPSITFNTPINNKYDDYIFIYNVYNSETKVISFYEPIVFIDLKKEDDIIKKHLGFWGFK